VEVGDFFKRYIPQGEECPFYLIGVLDFVDSMYKINILQIMADFSLFRGYFCVFEG